MGSFGPNSATVDGNIRADNGYFFSEIFTFDGGGTQDIFTMANGEQYLVSTLLYNYGGSDDRHGKLYLIGKAVNGDQPTVINLITELDTTGSINLKSGTTDVLQYSAGGGNPYTQILFLRVA